MLKARKVILVIVVLFVLYAVLNSPEQSADVVNAAFDQILEGLRAIGRFFDRLIQG